MDLDRPECPTGPFGEVCTLADAQAHVEHAASVGDGEDGRRIWHTDGTLRWTPVGQRRTVTVTGKVRTEDAPAGLFIWERVRPARDHYPDCYVNQRQQREPGVFPSSRSCLCPIIYRDEHGDPIGEQAKRQQADLDAAWAARAAFGSAAGQLARIDARPERFTPAPVDDVPAAQSAGPWHPLHIEAQADDDGPYAVVLVELELVAGFWKVSPAMHDGDPLDQPAIGGGPDVPGAPALPTLHELHTLIGNELAEAEKAVADE